MQQRVEQRGGVPGREHEAVAVGPHRQLGIEPEEPRPQRVAHRRQRHRRARVTRVRRLHRVHREHADGVDGQLVDRLGVEVDVRARPYGHRSRPFSGSRQHPARGCPWRVLLPEDGGGSSSGCLAPVIAGALPFVPHTARRRVVHGQQRLDVGRHPALLDGHDVRAGHPAGHRHARGDHARRRRLGCPTGGRISVRPTSRSRTAASGWSSAPSSTWRA